MDRLSRALFVAVCASGPALGGAQNTHAAPADPEVQRPKQLDPSSPSEKPSDPDPPATETQDPAPKGPQGVPESQPEPTAPPEDPARGAEPTPTPPPDAVPQPHATKPELLPEEQTPLLAPSKEDVQPKSSPRRVLTEEEKGAREAEAVAEAFRSQYRPQSNPARFNMSFRGLFTATATLDATVGGRMGGASADFGVTWNSVGVAATGTVLGGRIVLPPERRAEIRTLVGGGPTVSLGRLALIRRGFLDLRLGYDFYFAPVREQLAGSSVKPQDEDFVEPDLTNLAPHGFRIRLDMGLLTNPMVPRKFWHGFGLGIGYQGLVGSLRGDLPYTSMLTMGLVYWLG